DRLTLRVPFFRFPITQSGKSDQHSLLLELDDGKNGVFYAAPRFYELSEIDQAWSRGEVAARSIFIRPQAIGRLDSDSHHIAYDNRQAYLCSEPRPIAFQTAAGLVKRLASSLAGETRPLLDALPQFNASLTDA